MPFSALPGFFRAFEKEGSEGVDSSVVDHLELINHESWADLYRQIPQDTDTEHYKLLILARHGQGYHNAAILRYGMEAWDSHWSLLDGDEHGEWLDSKLTDLGQGQVQSTGHEVLTPIIEELQILPHVFFSSPMRRCLETFIGSWGGIFAKNSHCLTEQTVPVQVIENIRETLGEHTCDKRVPHSMSVEEYQNYKTHAGHTIDWIYDPDYPEEDQLWLEDHRESNAELDQRLHTGLSQIFSQLNSDQRFVSITCHSGVISSALRNLKHPPVQNLNTGKIVCAVVKIDVEKLQASEPSF